MKFFKENMGHNEKVLKDLKNVYDEKYRETSGVA